MRLPEWLCAIFLFVAIALSRLPFLDAGYGTNIDGWRVARAARNIAKSGRYETSRFPGSPVQEIISSRFSAYGAAGLNALSAAFSVVASIALWGIAQRLRCRDSLLIVGAFAFTPVIFLSSVIAKDYIWAIAFILLAFWAVLAGRAMIAGLLLGLAVGCRITSGAMFLPLAFILWDRAESIRWKKIGIFALTTLPSSALCYLPVYQRYGVAFFTFYDGHARPAALTMFTRATHDIWGWLGVLALTSAFVCAAVLRKKKLATSIFVPSNRVIAPALVTIIGLYVVAYLRLPDQSGYLVPIIPTVLLLAAQYVPRHLFQFACVALFISPWVDFGPTGVTQGMIVADYKERKKTVGHVTRFIGFAEEILPGRNVVVVGGWEPMIDVLGPKSALHNDYRGLLSLREVQEAEKAGYRIAYTTDLVRAFNFRETGVDLAQYGAIDLRKARIVLNR